MHLSVDVGGTFIKYAWMHDDKIIRQDKKETPLTSLEDFSKVMTSIWDEEEEKSGLSISLPGTIDPVSGFVFQGGSLRFHDQFNVKEYYEELFKVPVSVENDARCAALAEMHSGNMKGVQNGIVLTFGTGVGGCVIIDGKIYRGTHLFSAEVSGLIAGDLKTEGLNAILGRKLGIGVFSNRVAKLKGLESATGYEVFDWVKKGDTIAVEAFEAYCDLLATQMFNMQILLDPQRICIGGGISENEVFVETIKKRMEHFYNKMPIPLPRFELEACKYHNNANILGAYYHFKNLERM